MQFITYFKNPHHFSLIVGFLSGIVSTIYLFLHNELINTAPIAYISFYLSVLVISMILATGSFVITELFIKELKWDNSKT